jgi:hypothetical protein
MNTEKRYQCRHIFAAGHRCGSPALRNQDFCYYHHTTRKPAPKNRPLAPFDLEIPIPEDRAAIQSAIGQILQRISSNQIDTAAPDSSSTASRSPPPSSPNPRNPRNPPAPASLNTSNPSS